MENGDNPAIREIDRSKRTLLALWVIPGIGPRTLEVILAHARGELARLLDAPIAEWAGGLPISPAVRRRLATLRLLGPLADEVLERCRVAGIGIAFPGDAGFPENLREIPDAPPLLFYRGAPGGPRRRVAMVGSRHPDTGFLPFARGFARQVAEAGVGIVSGAAQGVDRACHWGALDAEGETWAFLGSALDALDSGQAKLLPHFLARGGVFFSELPPGVRASSATFPRRNRLISGAADAVLILRAGRVSGSLYTALAALAQGRPLLALPGEMKNEAALGCNILIRSGKARLCLSPGDLCAAAGVKSSFPSLSPGEQADQGAGRELSEQARLAYQALLRRPRGFEEILSSCRLSSAALTSALCELELSGLVVQHPGKLYERI